MDKWEIADNIDLYYILQDFEEYFEMKFLKKPVLVKKGPEGPSDIRAKKGLPPKMAGKGNTGGRNSTSATTASEAPSSEPQIGGKGFP